MQKADWELSDDELDKALALDAERIDNLRGWRSIETAPKDGTPLLGFVEKVMYVCWWDGLGWSFFVDGRGSRFAFFPTHWMPLPEPPIAKATTSEGAA